MENYGLMMMRGMMVVAAGGLMEYPSESLAAVWASLVLEGKFLTFTRTAERSTSIVCRVSFYTAFLKGDGVGDVT